jgi:hypothetical protein
LGTALLRRECPIQVQAYVTRGRTVYHDSLPHGPGTMLTLRADEAAHLARTGFLQDEPPLLEPAPAEIARENPSGIGLQTQQVKFQGPTYRR